MKAFAANPALWLIGLIGLCLCSHGWAQEADREPPEAKRQLGQRGGLQLRVAPRMPEMVEDLGPEPLISPQQRDGFVRVLQEEGKMASREHGRFRWFPLRGVMEEFRDSRLIVAKGPGDRGYVLLADRPSLVMVHSEDPEKNWAVIEASLTFDRFGAPAVEFVLDSKGGELLGELTGENIERNLAIVLDGRVYSAPMVQDRLARRGLITGNFSEEEANRIAGILRADMRAWPAEDRWGVWPWIIGAGAVVLLAILAAVVVTIRGRSRSAA